MSYVHRALLLGILGGSQTLASYLAGLGAAVQAYYDYTRSALYQDSAATTPAAVGDPVGHFADLSGNGNHATQTTAGNRPVRRDGGIEFTAGSSHHLFANAVAALISGTDKALSVAARFSIDGGAGTTRAPWGFNQNASATPQYVMQLAANDTFVLSRRDDASSAGNSGGQATAVGSSYDLISSDTGIEITVYVDGVPNTPVAVDVGAMTVDRFAIGCRPRATPDLFTSMTLKYLIVINRAITAAEAATLTALML